VKCCVYIVLDLGRLCCRLGKRVMCIRAKLLCSVCMWVIFGDGARFGLVVVSEGRRLWMGLCGHKAIEARGF
jgi:hypothetical protein